MSPLVHDRFNGDDSPPSLLSTRRMRLPREVPGAGPLRAVPPRRRFRPRTGPAGRSLGLVLLDGCVVVRCPLHEAAPLLVKALEGWLSAIPEPEDRFAQELGLARAAIAAAVESRRSE